MFPRWYPPLVLLLSAALVRSAGAANPKITLNLEAVTAREAVAALSKAAGIPIQFYTPPPGIPLQPQPALEEKATFDWKAVPFAQALRQLAQKYHLTPQPIPGPAYILNPGQVPQPAAVRRVGLAEKAGMRLFVRQLGVEYRRSVNFEGGQEFESPGSMNLTLGVEWESGDTAHLAGVANLVAKDDLGNLLFHDHFGPARVRGSSGTYPDEWSSWLSLPAPHPRAKKLLWLEGDLLIYKHYKPVRVEFPVEEKGTTRQVGDATIELRRVEVRPANPNPAQIQGDPGQEVTVDAGVFVPSGSQLSPTGGGLQFGLTLVGASGKGYSFGSGGGGGGGGAEGARYNLNYRFIVQEPIVAVRFHLEEKSEPEKLLSFRLTNVPLPLEGVYVARKAMPRPTPAGSATPAPERPFQEAGGGTLTSRIEILGQPVAGGAVSVGLALKTGAEWSGIRWTEVETGTSGGIRLSDLKPGTYRVLRVYRPKDTPTVTGAGRWENGEVTVEVARGKETSMPSLRWVLDASTPPRKKPAGSPGSARKPAGKR